MKNLTSDENNLVTLTKNYVDDLLLSLAKLLKFIQCRRSWLYLYIVYSTAVFESLCALFQRVQPSENDVPTEDVFYQMKDVTELTTAETTPMKQTAVRSGLPDT